MNMKSFKRSLLRNVRLVSNKLFNKNRFNNQGVHNSITYSNCIVNNLHAVVKNNNNKIYIGDNTILSDCFIDIKGDNNIIRIGKNCRIGKTEFWINGNNCTIELNDEIYIRSSHIACGNNNNSIEIGNNCLIAYNVEIRNNDSHKIYDLHSKELINSPKDICIEDKVWIGGNSTIMKGVVVSRGSVIGGGSIVTKNVEAHSIYAGVPAKKIKSNIYWEA